MFITKDSGERKEFASGMVRDTSTAKTLWHLIAHGPMLRRFAELLTRGAAKYGPGNWLKANGVEERERFRESAFRHFMQWYNGDTDEDHAAAVWFNVNGFEYVKERMETSAPRAAEPELAEARERTGASFQHALYEHRKENP
jgi:hypothetical protein